mgnify:CR=1 FL=1
MGEQDQLHKGPSRPRWQCTHPDVSAYGGKALDAFVQHQDLMPTLLELMGIEAPERYVGADLWPLVRGETGGARDHVIMAFGNYASVRTRAWNHQTPWVKNEWEEMAEGQRKLSPPELYDLQSDLDELHGDKGRLAPLRNPIEHA